MLLVLMEVTWRGSTASILNNGRPEMMIRAKEGKLFYSKLSRSPLSESHFPGYPKTSTEHPLLWRHVPHFMDDQVLVTWLHHTSKPLGNPLTDLDPFFHVVVALGGEAMDVYHWQLRRSVRLEEVFVAVVEAVIGAEEVDCRRGQVHDKMGDCLWDGKEDGGWGPRGRFGVEDAFSGDGDGILVGGG
jgi:hypothetical protein